MEEHDFQVGQIIRIKQDDEILKELPHTYKEILDHEFEITRVERGGLYPIGARDVAGRRAVQFQLSEIELHNSLLSDVQKESTKF